jgi:hypothetical protein
VVGGKVCNNAGQAVGRRKLGEIEFYLLALVHPLRRFSLKERWLRVVIENFPFFVCFSLEERGLEAGGY